MPHLGPRQPSAPSSRRCGCSSRSAKTRGCGPTTPNGYVYDTYLRARRDIWSFVPERLARAEEELTRALAAAGEHVLLYDGLGTLHWQYINSGIVTWNTPRQSSRTIRTP